MTYPNDCTLPNEIPERIADQGLDHLPELIRVVVNAAMKAERQQYLGVSPFERSEKRRDQANGFKPKTERTRIGEVEFAVPQVRSGEYYPQALEKLCGSEVSSSPVSQATAELDALLETWRKRPLGEIRYLFLDARYDKVRMDGQVVEVAVLIAQQWLHSANDGFWVWRSGWARRKPSGEPSCKA